MGDYKRLKDPIYGYIEIPEEYMKNIVDTAEFQRLRYVIQTGYAPLYASAIHNRFIHSLGVFYLGEVAFTSFMNTVEKEYPEETINWERYKKIFSLACLLHDVGHAPFSHTGENYYLDRQKSSDEMHQQMTDCVKDESLKSEIFANAFKAAAPHEIMSVIVALQTYQKQFASVEDKSFFARCITGYQYENDGSFAVEVKNCLINLLNSSVIDVDKLDYLIRDAYSTGFDTVEIDYRRLLNALTAIREEEGALQLAFHKSALSVIENVVYAHDAERKWIQNHPVVLYEAYLLQLAIRRINDYFGQKGIKLFSFDTLSKEGKKITEGVRISLLNDSDILFLMKNVCSDISTEEFLERTRRRHPIWKSEAEYKALFYNAFGRESDVMMTLEKRFEDLVKYLGDSETSCIINQEALQKCQNELRALEQRTEEVAVISESDRKLQMKKKRSYLGYIQCFEQVSHEWEIPFDFLILKANQFNSGFLKEAFANINIVFPKLTKPRKFETVVNTLKSEKSLREKFFYIYYRRNEENQAAINSEQLAKSLVERAMRE